jgi:hypothetical protein
MNQESKPQRFNRGVAPHRLEGSRPYALLDLKAGAEKINSEAPENLISGRLPEMAPDMAPKSSFAKAWKDKTDAILNRATLWVNSPRAAVRGSRWLNTVSGGLLPLC